MKDARFFVLAIIILAVPAAIQAVGAVAVWNGGGSDALASNAQNWNGARIPVSGEEISVSGGSVSWDLAGVVPSSFTASANIVLRVPLVVIGNLRITGGTLKTGGNALNVGGDFMLAGGGIEAGDDHINVSGDWTATAASSSLAASTVTMNGNNSKAISSGGQAFGNLTISAQGATVAAADDLAVEGTLRINAGNLSPSVHTISVQNGVNLEGGTLSLGSGKLKLSGSLGRPLAIAGGTLNAPSGSTVEYQPTGGSITVEPATYGDLKLSGRAFFSLGGDVTADGTVTIADGATFSPAGHALIVAGGNLVNYGMIIDGIIRAPALGLEMLGADGAAISSLKSSSGTVSVRVEDRDLNRKGDQVETVAGTVTVTTLGGDQETLAITETGAASGIFQTQNIVVHQGEAKTQNGQIETGQSDIVFVKYVDPWDVSDAKTIQKTVSLASLAASGVPQIVSGPSIGKWSSQNSSSGLTYSAHITWETDRESSSSVSVTSPQLTAPLSAGSLTGTTSHDVAVSGLVSGRSYSFVASSMTAEGKSVASGAKKFVVIADGNRLKSSASPAVYWYLNGKRYVFPDFASYDSWFADWKGIVVIPAEQLADIPLGKVVPVRAGTYLVKIQSDPKTYAVEPYGKLRWVPTEALAVSLFGSRWSTRVRDLDVSQFASYAPGEPLEAGKAPDGFTYQIGGGQWNAVVGRTTHQLSETARKTNGLSSRFVNMIAPPAVAAMPSGGDLIGYEPAISGVAVESGMEINAPAVGT